MDPEEVKQDILKFADPKRTDNWTHHSTQQVYTIALKCFKYKRQRPCMAEVLNELKNVQG